MTEQANGPAGEGQQTTAAASTALTDQGSNGGAANWVAGLQAEENRALVEAKQWASPDDALKSYRELQTHASKALTVPGDNATAEDWDRFYSKLGRPETPDKYELKLNTEAVPQDFPYDEKSAIEFRNWAHDAGLSPRQAQALHDKFVGYQANGFNTARQAVEKAQGDAHREIVREWGDPDTNGYRQNVELMSRAVAQLGLKDSLIKGGIISADGSVLDHKVAFAFAKVGKELYGEDTMATNANGVLKNPFSDDAFNLTEQGRLVRDDPRKAAALMRAAGKNPASYGLK